MIPKPTKPIRDAKMFCPFRQIRLAPGISAPGRRCYSKLCMRRVALALISSAFALWGDTAYAGAEACGRCHQAEFRLQSASEHARALYPAAGHPLASQFATRAPLQRPPAFDFRVMLEERGLLVRIASGERAAVLPVEWAFGAGDQAVTFVSRTGPESYLEHYFSYYTRTGKMGITPGQEAIAARSIADAAGFVHRGLDAVGCFQCHSTGPVDISGGALRPHELGVRCEACHEAGGEHVASGGKAAIRNPRRLSPNQLNDLCGKCHRLPPAAGADFDWNNSWNVRFEPAYLSRSACFRKSDRLSCLTCHGAHDRLLRNDAAHYNAVCADCHAAAHRGFSRTDCTGCHMPRVSPRPPLAFTNHWIGIYDPAKPVKPVR
jgi:hypothetical protein